MVTGKWQGMSKGLVAKSIFHSKNSKWLHKLEDRKEDREREENSGR